MLRCLGVIFGRHGLVLGAFWVGSRGAVLGERRYFKKAGIQITPVSVKACIHRKSFAEKVCIHMTPVQSDPVFRNQRKPVFTESRHSQKAGMQRKLVFRERQYSLKAACRGSRSGTQRNSVFRESRYSEKAGTCTQRKPLFRKSWDSLTAGIP